MYENHSDNEMEIGINLDFEIEKYPKTSLYILIESKNSVIVPGIKLSIHTNVHSWCIVIGYSFS